MKKLPKIALGTWSWGTGFAGGDTVFGNNLSDEQMKEVFDTAMQAGLNLWDTAAVYGMGSSEEALGKLVRQYPRDDIIVSTKFTPQIADLNKENPVEAMLEDSLKRLGVDDIDIYWIHNPFDVEKWTPGLIPLLKSGKVKRIGVSNHNLSQIQRANTILGEAGFSVSAVQNHYSLLYRDSEDAGILDYCKKHDIQFFAYMVLEQGALSGRYNPQNPMPEGSGRAETYNKFLPQLQKLTDTMKAIGEKKGASVAQVAIAWAINKGTLPIIGATKVHHIADAALAANLELTEAEIATIEQLSLETGVDTRGAWEQSMS